ncbi:hypothetical protein AXG93_138s1120 [Marchantia polymorpha subsp. ruderalis]|uniref:Uncharacterized protein n=1 Tax=Marchantia polymorpha subsp. ruderalis TaxID=1480154 RepID=A0A176VNH1_MARPO|nr:hypothetical protein AXG93_138s1120 [Marchantia polymorpha subsp. ruderalis]
MSSLNTCVKAHCVEHLGDPAIPLEELRLASEKFRREVGDRIFEKRLLRAVALFAGSVFVMRNFGELMAV